MSVDKFGLTGDASEITTIIKPYNNYDMNLDDLENVEGFNEEGDKTFVYGFQLDEFGIYKRSKIASGFSLDNEGYEDEPLNLVWTDNSWRVTPSSHQWDIDINLNNSRTLSTKGENQNLLKIFNSGRILGSLVPNRNYKPYVKLTLIDKKHYIYTERPRVILSFKTKFKEERNSLSDLSDMKSIIIIDGLFKTDDDSFNDIINGLKIKWSAPKGIFRIMIEKTKDDIKVKTSPPGLEHELDASKLNLKEVWVWKNYNINRVRYSNTPI